MTIAAAITQVKHWLERSRSAVVFTGAGISTDSGIPDFRSPGGLWSRYRPIDFSEFMRSEEARRESWRRRFAMSSVLDAAKPNRGHYAVARGVDAGTVRTVITQNIDGLHQAAGVAADRVVELHGNVTYARCLDCGSHYALEDIQREFQRQERAPVCFQCGGYVKTATVSFGQPMPSLEMQRAEEATLSCDVFLAVGSSLVVFPAASFPELAKRNGAKLVIVNRDATDLDAIADHVFHTEISPTLDALFPESATRETRQSGA